MANEPKCTGRQTMGGDNAAVGEGTSPRSIGFCAIWDCISSSSSSSSKAVGAARKRKECSVATRSVKEDDTARKRGTRLVTARVTAQQKRTVQGAVFPTSDADRKRFTRQQAKQARERNAAEATATIAAEAGAAAEDGVDSAGATKTQRAQARIAPFKRSFHEAISKRSLHQELGSAQPGPVVFQDATMEGAAQSGLEAVKHFFDNGGMRRNTCGCCNELKSPSQTRTVAIEEGGPWITRLKKRLSWVYTTFGECSSDMIERTKQHYSSPVPILCNIPLAPNGVVVGADNSVKVILCIRCSDSLRRGKPHADVPPPPLAICNNWAVIPLPLSIVSKKPNWAEHSVTALAQVAVKYEVCGNSRKKLLSHSLLFKNDCPAAGKLPRTLTSLEYFVVFANLTDDEATVQRKRRLLVRREVTDEISALYRENLSMYRDIPTNHDYYPGDSSERLLEENSHDDGQDSTIITDVLESSDRVGAVQHFSDVEVVSATGFLRASQGGEGNPTIQVTRSNEIVDHRQKSYEIAGFPDLHSNGLGTVYDDSREIHVSPPEARRHLLSIGERGFAQHPVWSFVQLDNGNKQYGQGRMTACLKRDPSLAVAGFQVTEEQLQAQARRQREVQSSLLSGTSLPPLPPSLQNAERVMRSINLVETSLRGSDKEREDMRRTMYAMTFQYGPPHFMLTVTPSDSANGMVATIACGNDTDQVNELFPKEFNVTDKATVERTIKIQKLATKDPAASAQLFMEIVEEILTNILGFDVKRHTSRQGLAGEVEWYGGGIENQELALLHCHLGIRIKNWPQWLKNMQSSSSSPSTSPSTKRSPWSSSSSSSPSPTSSSSSSTPSSSPSPSTSPSPTSSSSPSSSTSPSPTSSSSPSSSTSSSSSQPDEISDANALTPEQTAALADYLGTCTFPVFELFKRTGDPSAAILCPSCGGDLAALTLTLMHKSDQVQQTPYVAECGNCSRKWTPPTLRAACEHEVIKIIGNSDFDPAQVYKAINLSPHAPLPAPVPNDEDLAKVRAILEQQIVTNVAQPLDPEKDHRLIQMLKGVLVLTAGLGIFQEHR